MAESNSTQPVNFKDYIETNITINGDEEEKLYDYNLFLINWTETHIELLLNFTNPLIISKGMFPDQLVCRIINSSFLVDNATGLEVESVQ